MMAESFPPVHDFYWEQDPVSPSVYRLIQMTEGPAEETLLNSLNSEGRSSRSLTYGGVLTQEEDRNPICWGQTPALIHRSLIFSRTPETVV